MHPTTAPSRSAVAALTLCLAIGLPACGGSDDDTAPDPATAAANAGLRTVGADTVAALLESPPTDLEIIDLRTPEEFSDGHLTGAAMIDFYAPDFADQLAELDPSTPYVIYCKSGNRSGQALALMETLGFTDVTNLDGGIQAWTDAGYQARS